MCFRYSWEGFIISKIPFLSLVIVTALLGNAEEILGADLPQLEFSLKPHLCVLSEEEEACYDELQVSWRASQPMSLCLHQSGVDRPLKCWRQAEGGAHKFVLSATQNVVFQLRASDDNTLVTEAFEVIHEHKEYRRQRRNPWSFF